jgi:hypothetical protein
MQPVVICIHHSDIGINQICVCINEVDGAASQATSVFQLHILAHTLKSISERILLIFLCYI